MIVKKKQVVTIVVLLGLSCVAGLVFAQQRGFGGRRGGGYGGYRGGGDGYAPQITDRQGVPDWEVDSNFKKDVFTFVRVQYKSWGRRGGWMTDWPKVRSGKPSGPMTPAL